MARRFMGVLLFAALLVSGGYLCGRAQVTPRQVTPSANSGESVNMAGSDGSRIESKLDEIEQRLGQLEVERNAHKLAPSSPAAPLPAPADEPEPSRDPETSQGAVLEKRFATEKRDSVWATVAEDSIRAAVAEAAGKDGHVTLRHLSCLTSVCKVDLVLTDVAGPQGTLPRFPALVSGMTGYRFMPPAKQDDGTYSIAYNFFREGYPLP